MRTVTQSANCNRYVPTKDRLNLDLCALYWSMGSIDLPLALSEGSKSFLFGMQIILDMGRLSHPSTHLPLMIILGLRLISNWTFKDLINKPFFLGDNCVIMRTYLRGIYDFHLSAWDCSASIEVVMCEFESEFFFSLSIRTTEVLVFKFRATLSRLPTNKRESLITLVN